MSDPTRLVKVMCPECREIVGIDPEHDLRCPKCQHKFRMKPGESEGWERRQTDDGIPIWVPLALLYLFSGSPGSPAPEPAPQPIEPGGGEFGGAGASGEFEDAKPTEPPAPEPEPAASEAPESEPSGEESGGGMESGGEMESGGGGGGGDE